MDQETKDRVLAIIKTSGLKNLFITQVKRADTFFKPRFIITINDRNLMTFNNRGTKITNQFSWLTVKYIGRELNKLRLQFDKTKFAFEFTEEALFREVSSALQDILTHSELRAIKFDQFRIPFKDSYSPSCVVNRIIEMSDLLKNPIYENTLDTIRSMLIYSQPDIKITDIPGIDKFLSIILDSLPFWSNIQTLSISEMGIIDPYQVTLPYASYFQSFKLLEMSCKKSPEFRNFMVELAKKDESQNKNLCGLSFTRSEFEEEDLIFLQKFITEQNLQTLELHDAFSRSAMDFFYKQFISVNMMNSLTILNLDRTKNVSKNISMIASKLTNLLALSLAECDIEISDALSSLSCLPRLRILNLSNNTCRKPINGLPPSLTTFYLNSVIWYSQTLQLFLTNLPSHHITLHLDDITVQQALDYDDLFVKLPTATNNFLTGLSWNGNRIEQGLFDFLGKNRYLSFLSLSNCFSNTDVRQVTMFQQYLTQFHSVKKLIVNGKDNKFLGNLVEGVIIGVLRSAQIEFLDLSKSRSGNLGMNQMKRIFTSNPNLKNFLFDGTEPANLNTLTDFLRESSQNTNVKLSFPINDVRLLLKRGQITEEDVTKIRSNFVSSSKPENVHITFYNNDFPRFLSASEIEELRKTVPYIDPSKESQPIQPQKRAESPKSNNKDTTNNNSNNKFGTLNMKATKLKTRIDFFGPSSNQNKRSPVKGQPEDQNEYLLKQNRKIQRMTPKENDRSFDSESASYNNQESSSNDFFIPNNYNNDNEAATVRNRPIRNNLDTSANRSKTKTSKRRRPKAASLAPAKKRSRNREEGEVDNRRKVAGSVRKPRRPRGNASQQPKTARRPNQSNQDLFDDEYERDNKFDKIPKSARGNRTTRNPTGGSRRKVRRPIQNDNDINDDDYDFDDDDDRNEINVKPMLRSRKTSRQKRARDNYNDNDNVDDEDLDNQEEEDELSFTYQQPTWEFPIKMKFIYDTDISKRIEEKYSNNSFASAILNGEDVKSRPKQRKTTSRKKKVFN